MRYTKNLTWEAVYQFVPSFRMVRENSIHMNLPSALKTAAVEAFLQRNTTECRLSLDKAYAMLILEDALTELNTQGWMTFGTVDQFWGKE